MTPQKTYTEREAVMRERAAYIAGLEAACWRDPATEREAMKRAEYDAAREYPIPPLMLGKYAGREYRLRNGVLEYQTRTHTPICGGDAPLQGRWDRASLQPEDVRHLALALEEIANAE